MKIQIASDLHLEFYPSGYPIIAPAPGADVLLLAGDIHQGVRGLEHFRDWPVPVVYVAGNHEFYGFQLADLRQQLRGRAEASGPGMRFLDDSATEIGRVRFLGATLWTDFRYGAKNDQEHADNMRMAESHMPDFKVIKLRNGGRGASRFTAEAALSVHRQSRAWLTQELAKPFDGPTVVVTHHGPLPESIAPQYAGDSLNPAFVSNLADLVPMARLWVHGHTHTSLDYQVPGLSGACRVVTNPAGYVMQHDTRGRPVLENRAFDPTFCVEV